MSKGKKDFVLSDETRLKMSMAKRNRKMPKETRDKISQSMKKKYDQKREELKNDNEHNKEDIQTESRSTDTDSNRVNGGLQDNNRPNESVEFTKGVVQEMVTIPKKEENKEVNTCGGCGRVLESKTTYCPYCGMHLDWSVLN